MKKGINTLIKLHQRTLDQQRRRMVELEEQKETLVQKAITLQEDLNRERELAAQQPEMAGYLPEFAKSVKQQQMQIAVQVAQLEQDMKVLSAKIAESFGELKKYEITKDNMLAREAEAARMAEQKEMDEVGAQQFRRKKSNASTDGGSGV